MITLLILITGFWTKFENAQTLAFCAEPKMKWTDTRCAALRAFVYLVSQNVRYV